MASPSGDSNFWTSSSSKGMRGLTRTFGTLIGFAGLTLSHPLSTANLKICRRCSSCLPADLGASVHASRNFLRMSVERSGSRAKAVPLAEFLESFCQPVIFAECRTIQVPGLAVGYELVQSVGDRDA